MGDWPLVDGQRYETSAVDAATSTASGIVTAAGSANTKGSWSQLIASTAQQSGALLIQIRKSAAGVDYLVDIGIGGSGSEVVLIPNIRGDGTTSAHCRISPIIWPVGVPAGTRISARCAASTLSSTCRVQVVPIAGGFAGGPPLSRVTDYGTNAADSGSVSVDSGGTTAHTKGAYSQITGSTTNPAKALVIMLGQNTDANRSEADWLMDIAIGGSGSEQIVIPDLHLESSTNDDAVIPGAYGPIPCNIPAGTRLAVRAQSSIIVADRLFDVTLYGID